MLKEGQMNASAYVQGNRLCILGIYQTPWGAIPFSHACACEADNGPVDFGKELQPAIQAAINTSQPVIMSKVEKEKIRLAAEEIVDRANHNEQNAKAMILAIRKNAEQGVPRAIYTMKCMVRYAASQESAPTSSAALAREIKNDEPMHVQAALNGLLPGVTGLQAVVVLANGPDLTKERIDNLIKSLDDEEKTDFALGFKNWKKGKARNLAQRIGKCVGYARAIQRIRQPNTSISVLCTDTAWELE